MEPRAETKGNARRQSTRRAQDRGSVSQALERIRQVAKQRKLEKFTSLLHHISPEILRTAFFATKRDAAPGADGMTWSAYEKDLDRRIEALNARIKEGAYRALPSRRVYIPKEDGSRRPLAVAALEDKIVQRATAMVLNAIYEEDFLGFSYGFRPGRGQHDALDALIAGISTRKVSPMVDDTEWSEAVGRAQKEGRRVTCCGAGSDRSRAEKDYAAASRFQLAPSGSIVDAPLP